MFLRVEEISEVFRVKLRGEGRCLDQLNKLKSGPNLWMGRQRKLIHIQWVSWWRRGRRVDGRRGWRIRRIWWRGQRAGTLRVVHLYRSSTSQDVL